jgi:hypothetical protein
VGLSSRGLSSSWESCIRRSCYGVGHSPWGYSCHRPCLVLGFDFGTRPFRLVIDQRPSLVSPCLVPTTSYVTTRATTRILGFCIMLCLTRRRNRKPSDSSRLFPQTYLHFCITWSDRNPRLQQWFLPLPPRRNPHLCVPICFAFLPPLVIIRSQSRAFRCSQFCVLRHKRASREEDCFTVTLGVDGGFLCIDT